MELELIDKGIDDFKKAIRLANSKDPGNAFVASCSKQLERCGRLSDKQLAALLKVRSR